ncbi:SecY-interacting protein [Pseudoalteromonas sp. L1]|uniref:SecY-interacting protein n=1 Tax=Pseudoalteromonas sp. L1 TaxID=195716 RepID=UPI001F009B40|nr:SecY-interacting protein [Pseudoalteromonas sp. L1]
MSVSLKLEKLHQAFSEKCLERTGRLPVIEHDEAWPSPCEQGDVDEQGLIQWRAAAQQPKGSLNDLANALELNFPEELDVLFGHLYAGNLLVRIDDHHIELLQAWNEDDFSRLQQNITGHVLMKRKLKQPETVFIGLTEQDDLLITVLVESGEVCLEYVGKKPHHVLANSISEFLDKVTV